jgi:hypothetical protein
VPGKGLHIVEERPAGFLHLAEIRGELVDPVDQVGERQARLHGLRFADAGRTFAGRVAPGEQAGEQGKRRGPRRAVPLFRMTRECARPAAEIHRIAVSTVPVGRTHDPTIESREPG